MIDILFVLPELSQTVGGVHTVIDLCRELNARGIKAQCLVLGKLSDAERAAFKEPLPEGGLLHASHWLRFVFETPVQPKLVVSTFFATALPAFLFSRLKGIPHIHYVQGYEFFFDQGRNYNQVSDAYRLTDAFLTTSEWLREGIRGQLRARSIRSPEVDHRTVERLPLGIDLARHTPGQNPEGKIRLGLVLRSGPDKGQAVLLDILNRLNRDEFALTLLASPGYAAPAGWATEQDTRIVALPLDRSALSSELSRCDLFLDASLHEGFGLLPLEAMACGAVPIVSDSGGVREYCHNDNSFVVPSVNKPSAYIDKLLELRKADIAELRKNGLKTVQNFDQKKTLGKYAEYFKELLADPPKMHAGTLDSIRAAQAEFDPLYRDALQTFFAIHYKQKTIADVLPDENYKQSGGYGFYSALKGILPLRLRRALYYLIVNPKE